MIACTIALSKTTWGRHLYATGGNAEAARRAGIDVVHMKVTAFILCSSFGAFGGIMLASSQSSASLDLGSGNVLLFSVAAAVIGGTSLFGGRGKPARRHHRRAGDRDHPQRTAAPSQPGRAVAVR